MILLLNICIKILRIILNKMAEDYLEFEKNKKIKTLNLDDFSIDELYNYIKELENEIERVKKEISKKNKSNIDAEKYFKKY
tara:strand:+ start:403 stop:645 length:243 start_codon:yes stop_codon:yes gene_type:complete